MFDPAGHLPELVILLFVALLVIGPGKLPETGSALGKALQEFRSSVRESRANGASAAPPPGAPHGSPDEDGRHRPTLG